MDLNFWKEREKTLYNNVAELGRLLRNDQEWIDAEFIRLCRNKIMWRKSRIREDSIGFFLEEKPGIVFEMSSRISSQELYEIYCQWCVKEEVVPEGLRALSWRLKHGEKLYPVRETLLQRNGRRVRGFRGIGVTDDTDKG